MNNKIFGAVLSATLLWSAGVIADPGFSIEALIGTADQDSDWPSGMRDISGDDDSIGLRGTYQLNDYFGIELSYNDYGSMKESYRDSWGDTITESYALESTNIGVVGYMPFSDGFSFTGRLGVASWDLDYVYADSFFAGYQTKVNDSGDDFYYGVGLRYIASNGFLISLEYTALEYEANLLSSNVDQTVDNLGLAIGYKF